MGDRVIKSLALFLKQRLRKTDFIARFGGEEFVLLIPATPLEGGVQLLETLRAAIEACPFHFKGEPVTITFSAGIAAAAADGPDEAIRRAKTQVLAAIAQGGNRVVA